MQRDGLKIKTRILNVYFHYQRWEDDVKIYSQGWIWYDNLENTSQTRDGFLCTVFFGFFFCSFQSVCPHGWVAVHIYHADNINAWTLLLLRFTLFFLIVQATLIESERYNWIHKNTSPAVLMSALRPAVLSCPWTGQAAAHIHIRAETDS